MVMSFFKKSSGGLEHVVTRSVGMLGDARRSFDLATLALLTDTDWTAVESDIRETDQRINHAEQELRSELVVHVAVQGSTDIGSVLGMILLLKKIERIGDQAKNVLDLAETGVLLDNEPDTDALLAERGIISTMFGEAAELLAEPDDERVADFTARAGAMIDAHQAEILGYMHSDRPGREVVPRAIYYRYLKRIVANLLGIVRSVDEPIPTLDYLDGGETDTED
ncbi:PhoU domain-containing protein [Ilumatobacter sp.]|uniref:PhoU domain-containing protein n=1 Tax=Ilumatobacter sp. TaxID=1967498 RepID=UPI003C4FDF97